MRLPVDCIPCPAPVRHAARHVAQHVHRRVFRPIGRRMHHVAHHVVHRAPRIIAYGCCAAAAGGLGGALVAPPGGFFVPPAIAEAPPVGGYGGVAQGWPEMPAYSGTGGGVAIVGGGAAFIPAYYGRPPVQPLGAAPYIGGTHGAAPIRTTSVPEPASALLLLAPIAGLAVVRRVRA